MPPKREEVEDEPPEREAGKAADTLPPEDGAASVRSIGDPPRAEPPKREVVEVADTLPPEDGAADTRSTSDPPVANWDRFELLGLLGKGGMGAVYKARDRRIDRIVAIKFLHSVDPTLTMRLLQEARAQGKVEHRNVCGVHDTGHVDGRAYIVLQYIDGRPLHVAAAELTLEHKVAVMRDVALAVHAAHERGIVHRDLKPANILVERTDEGRWNPIVMDFGLARELATDVGITQTGVPLGTPAYMPPEQARGDVHAVDRRSDVYSLGATLYELWTGRVPLPAATPYQAVERAIHDDPPALRSLVPGLPVDLETIALKCLAKDPNQRYPSARALADDLGRYLAGEPILGRRLPLWQRLARRARRHRALVILGAGSLVAIAVVAALGIRTWLVSAERARLAERLSREASDIESSLREAYLQPLHDTRGDRARIRERMRRIEAQHPDLGELGDAIVHQALGRGHLALHEWRDAADELARAAAGGLETPELHAARGRALGELYRRALDEVGRPAGADDARGWLAERDAELVREYLDPALSELELSRASGDDAALLEARIALYRRDFATAERRAREITAHGVVSPEVLRLAGDAAYLWAVQAFDHGDDAIARPALEHATAQYKAASEIARSDASLYRSAAAAWLQIAEIDFRQKASPREALDQAIDLVENHALLANPDDAPSYVTESAALLRRYRTRSPGDQEDKRPLLDRIVQAAARAVEIDRQDAHAWTGLGIAYIYRGSYEFFHSGQGNRWWQLALDAFDQALAIQPRDPRANNNLGLVHRWLGAELDKTGSNPVPEFQKAQSAYERASEIDPQYLHSCINQAELHTLLAEYHQASDHDPEADAQTAEQVGARCLTLEPTHFGTLNALARAELALAQYLVAHDRAPTDALGKARNYLTRSEEGLPNQAELWYHRLEADRVEATFLMRKHEDPMSAITAGRAAFAQVKLVMSDSAMSFVEVARLDLIEAAWVARAATDSHAASRARTSLFNARRDARTATQLDDRLPEAQLVAAEACLELAITDRSQEIAREGIEYARRALALNPRLPGAQRVLEKLLQLTPQ